MNNYIRLVHLLLQLLNKFILSLQLGQNFLQPGDDGLLEFV